MIDQLKLFRGEGYKINDKILIRQPTLEEIVDFGEQRYFGLVRTICSTPADRKVEIWDELHVFWEKIDEYDLFISLFQTLQKSEVSILFGDMDFTTFNLGTLQMQKPFQSLLLPLISSLTNCPEFKYRWDDVWTLPIGVFMDSVERVQKHKSYNFVMQGIYSGCVDMKKLDKKELHWMGDLK